MASVLSLTPQLVAAVIQGLLIFAYVECASVALLVYDYVLTLSSEVEYIWSNLSSPIAILFLVVRYLPMVDSAIVLTRAFSNTSEKSYEDLYKVQVYLYVVALSSSSTVLLLRTSAIWCKTKLRVFAGLSLLLLSVVAASFYFCTLYLGGLDFQLSPAPSLAPGHFVEDNKNNLYIPYALVMVFETVVLFLTLLKATGQRQASTLHRTIYKDSLSFYFYLFAISVANVAVLSTGPAELRPILTSVHRVLHSIFSGRLILNINEAANNARDAQTHTSSFLYCGTSVQYPTSESELEMYSGSEREEQEVHEL